MVKRHVDDNRPMHNIKRPRRDPLDVEELRKAVKSGQRSSPDWQEAWTHWCQENSEEGRSDPAVHDIEFIGEFFAHAGRAYIDQKKGSGRGSETRRRGGERNVLSRNDVDESRPRRVSSRRDEFSQGKGVKAGGGIQLSAKDKKYNLERMILFVKIGQKADEEFKNMWAEHCFENGGGTKDPAKHNANFFTAFLFRYGMGKMAAHDWTLEFLQDISNCAFSVVVDTIKIGQRKDKENWSVDWAEFCDDKCNEEGVVFRDPARQNPGSLFQFMEHVAIANYSHTEWMVDFLAGR